MAGVITYGCRKCGCEIIISGADESQMRPIYCCGSEVAGISPAAMKTDMKNIKRKTSPKAQTKAANKAKGKITRKTSVRRKSPGR